MNTLNITVATNEEFNSLWPWIVDERQTLCMESLVEVLCYLLKIKRSWDCPLLWNAILRSDSSDHKAQAKALRYLATLVAKGRAPLSSILTPSVVLELPIRLTSEIADLPPLTITRP